MPDSSPPSPASPLPSAAPARRPDPGSPTAALISWIVIVVIVGGIALMTLLSALPSRKADASAPSAPIRRTSQRPHPARHGHDLLSRPPRHRLAAK